MTTDDPNAAIRLAQDLGAIKQGVKTLDEGQREVARKITGLQRAIGNLVTRDDCRSHRADLTARVKPPLSSGVRPAVRDRSGLLELAGRKAGALTTILGLLAMLVVGTVVIARFVASVERTIAKDRVEQRQQTGRVLDELRSQERRPIVIQHHTTIAPDTGPPRRRARRRRRTQ